MEGTNAEVPYDKVSLPSYYSGEISNVGLEEFENLIQKKIPISTWDKKQELGYNDAILQCKYAKSIIARIIYYLMIFIHWLLKKVGKRDKANIMVMSIFNMPFRGISRMTGGIVNMPMLDGILMMVNGKFFRGLIKFIQEKNNLKRSKRNK